MLTSDQPQRAQFSSISCTVAPGREGGGGGGGSAAEHEDPSPPPLPTSQNPLVSGPQAVCVCERVCMWFCVCALPYFGPVLQRPLYLRSELSSITRPAPVTQSLLNGPACNDKHTCSHRHTHTRYGGQRHCGARPERRHSDMHVNKQEVTAQSPLG